MKHFEGLYYKHHKNDRSLAVIPGRSGDGAFIQIITDNGSYMAEYTLNDYTKRGKSIMIGGSEFFSDGIKLSINRDGLSLSGSLKYSGLSPLRYDIMGPFRFLPMECRHMVASMRHKVTGVLTLNGEELDFNGGTGYIEGDSGRSFPDSYTWVQCECLPGDASFMASAAKIPFAGLRFWGCTCAVHVDDTEYRLATYLGAGIKERTEKHLAITQSGLMLDVEIQGSHAHRLLAPDDGIMSRTVLESVAVPARVRFWKDGKMILDEETPCAAYEYS